jgi:hypothetical protein
LNNSALPNGAELLTKANIISAEIMGVGKETTILKNSVLLNHAELLTKSKVIKSVPILKPTYSKNSFFSLQNV